MNKTIYLFSIILFCSCAQRQVFIGKRHEGLVLNERISHEKLIKLGFSNNEACNCYFRMNDTLINKHDFVIETAYLFGERFLDSLSIEYYFSSETEMTKKEAINRITEFIERKDLIPTNFVSIDTTFVIGYRLKWR